jgi:hypothetical protein
VAARVSKEVAKEKARVLKVAGMFFKDGSLHMMIVLAKSPKEAVVRARATANGQEKEKESLLPHRSSNQFLLRIPYQRLSSLCFLLHILYQRLSSLYFFPQQGLPILPFTKAMIVSPRILLRT